MPTTYVVANRASNTLSAGLSANPATIAVTDASTFPSPSAGQACLVLVRAAADSAETGVYAVYQYTSRASNTLSGVTYVSGTNGAGGGTWTSGDTIAVRDVAELVTKFSQIDANESITGTKTYSDGAAVQAGAEKFEGLSSLPTIPGSSQVGLFARKAGAAAVLPRLCARDAMGDTSRQWPLQELQIAPLRGAHCSYTMILNDTTTAVGYGRDQLRTVTGGGVSAATAAAAGSAYTEQPRYRRLSLGIANSVVGYAQDANTSASNARSLWRGSATGRGGFQTRLWTEAATLTQKARVAIGVTTDTTYMVALNPSSFTTADFLILGSDDNDADDALVLMFCDGTTFKRVPLTTPRTKLDASGRAYLLTVECTPNASSMYVLVQEFEASGSVGYQPRTLFDQLVTDNTTVNGVTGVRLPRNSVFMRQICAFGSGNVTPAAQSLCLLGHYCESYF